MLNRKFLMMGRSFTLALTLATLGATLPLTAHAMECELNHKFKHLSNQQRARIYTYIKAEREEVSDAVVFIIVDKKGEISSETVNTQKSNAIPRNVLNRDEKTESVLVYYPPGKDGYILHANESISGPACLSAQKNDRFLAPDGNNLGCAAVNLRGMKDAKLITGSEVDKCTVAANLQRNSKSNPIGANRTVSESQTSTAQKKAHSLSPIGGAKSNVSSKNVGSDKRD